VLVRIWAARAGSPSPLHTLFFFPRSPPPSLPAPGGYTVSASPEAGGTGALAAINPLYMRYVPDAAGRFAGQTGYGYRSIEAFVEGCSAVRSGAAGAAEVSAGLASVSATLYVTAILEAGRRSLDAGGAAVRIVYEGEGAGEGGAAAAGGARKAVNVLAKPAGFA